jgi:lysophospholipase L1-like esterase
VVVFAGVLLAAYRWRTQPGGEELNRLAWEASFQERGLVPPAGGPRDGYWGKRMPKPVPDDVLGWREAEAHIPGLVESDVNGSQWAGADAGSEKWRVAIVGASVAWGSYASDIRHTYFVQLADRLSMSVGPVRIEVTAAGAWDSENELKALGRHVLPRKPDVVVVLDGLNDLTGSANRRRRQCGWPPVERDVRVSRYLENMARIRAAVLAEGAVVVFAPQPFLPGKKHQTRLERRVLALTLDKELTESYLREEQGEQRRGLEALARGRGTFVLDTSGIFDAERATTFTDVFHFADPAHALLADALVRGLEPLLRAMPPRRRP